ncbi:MAG: hypothetical protein MJZ93_03135 [Paludibacteraceae bacterium]|nr:hypothetical protein [Paludibacteraceae bacterium]
MKDGIHFYGDNHNFNPKWLLLIPAIAVIGALAYLLYVHFSEDEKTTETIVEQPKEIDEQISHEIDIELAQTESRTNIIDTIINDIQVRLYIPPAEIRPRLRMGYDIINDTADIMLCFAAADAGMNDKIIGAYIQDGEIQSTGLSKKGFCAITSDSIFIGMSENSPQFEQAVNEKGSFFRQRALVDSGRIVINELRGTFLCRALCAKERQVFAVHCMDRCSLYDFSQLLKDLGVEQAISLQSATDAKGWYHDNQGKCILIGDWTSRKYPKSANYIIWSL